MGEPALIVGRNKEIWPQETCVLERPRSTDVRGHGA